MPTRSASDAASPSSARARSRSAPRCASRKRAYSYAVCASQVAAPMRRFSSMATSKCRSASSGSPSVAASMPR